MLIDTSYFTAGPRMVANATCGSMSSLVDDHILGYVAELQQPFLSEAIGEEAAADAHSYLCELDEDPAMERDAALDAMLDRLRQPFADYVFWHVLRDGNTLAMVNGLVEVKNANKTVSPIGRQVSVWNAMVFKLESFDKWRRSGECEVKGIAVSRRLLTPINKFNL